MDLPEMKSLTVLARERFNDQLAVATRGIKRPNILLLGKTGAGKSSLLNTVFGEKLAEVSHVAPETRGFHTYSVEKIPVNIIDSEGYELDGEDAFKQSLAQYLSGTFDDVTHQVHICWYCISVGTNRVLPFDIELMRVLGSHNIPVAVVLTQCDLDTPTGDIAAAMRVAVQKTLGVNIPCFEVSTDVKLNAELGQLDKLVAWSTANIPDANLRLGFIAAQRVSLKSKDEAAEQCVRRYAATAGGVGVTPLPISDSIVLAGMQMKMSADIYAIYGFDNSLRHGLQDFIQERIAGTVGKMVAGNIIKAIPVGGQAVGAVINAGVASSITYALGRTVARACSKACQAAWDGDDSRIDMIFSAEHLYEMFRKIRFDIETKKPEEKK